MTGAVDAGPASTAIRSPRSGRRSGEAAERLGEVRGEGEVQSEPRWGHRCRRAGGRSSGRGATWLRPRAPARPSPGPLGSRSVGSCSVGQSHAVSTSALSATGRRTPGRATGRGRGGGARISLCHGRRSLLTEYGGFDPTLRVCQEHRLVLANAARWHSAVLCSRGDVRYRYRTDLRGVVSQAGGYGRCGPILFGRYESSGMERRSFRSAARFWLGPIRRALKVQSRADWATLVFSPAFERECLRAHCAPVRATCDAILAGVGVRGRSCRMILARTAPEHSPTSRCGRHRTSVRSRGPVGSGAAFVC